VDKKTNAATKRQVYQLMVNSLKTIIPNVEEKLEYYRKLDCTSWDDNDFFEVLTGAVFTGIKEDIIESKWSAIKTAFSNFDFRKVAKYNEKDIKKLENNPDIIKHKGRIRATVNNAKKMEEIVREHGSFLNYINSFKNPDDLIADLQEQFDFIGGVNVFEFLKELGLPFIKPERQVKKVFLRLGLINEETSEDKILKIGKSIAKAVKERPCVVDWVIWSFGRDICKKINPDCEQCHLTHLCQRGLNPYVST